MVGGCCEGCVGDHRRRSEFACNCYCPRQLVEIDNSHTKGSRGGGERWSGGRPKHRQSSALRLSCRLVIMLRRGSVVRRTACWCKGLDKRSTQQPLS